MDLQIYLQLQYQLLILDRRSLIPITFGIDTTSVLSDLVYTSQNIQHLILRGKSDLPKYHDKIYLL